jgi:hypothetical protein
MQGDTSSVWNATRKRIHRDELGDTTILHYVLKETPPRSVGLPSARSARLIIAAGAL